MCYYQNGKMVGQFWRGSLGGGYITGEAIDNDATGDNIAYIFPNLEGNKTFMLRTIKPVL